MLDEGWLHCDLVHITLSRTLDKCNSFSLIAHITFITVACTNITCVTLVFHRMGGGMGMGGAGMKSGGMGSGMGGAGGMKGG